MNMGNKLAVGEVDDHGADEAPVHEPLTLEAARSQPRAPEAPAPMPAPALAEH